MTVSTSDILERVEQLPTLSRTACRVNGLVGKEGTTLAQIERVIRPDPALTANLLRIVNSAAFGLRFPVSSLRQALSLLGHKGVMRVVATETLGRVVPSHILGYRMSAEQYWLHCAAVAILGEKLARRLDSADTELAFTAGLLHDIGKLAVGASLERVVDDVVMEVAGGEEAFVSRERARLGTDHAEIGRVIAERWKLPAPIVAAVRWHHDPMSAPDEFRGVVVLVHAANALAHSLGLGSDAGELARRVDEDALRVLALTPIDLERTAAESVDEVEQLVEVFAESARPLGGSTDKSHTRRR